ncbi:MAG: hypothetical protein ACD_74C00017G0001 [uncultured bacterium]|nr:MAG: hypothetical protein ACD_74C00017G0001 [uncultured bacterium]
MEPFLLGLGPHPLRRAGQADGVEIGGHGQIHVGGIEFRIDLLVESLFHGFAQHIRPSRVRGDCNIRGR